MAYLRDEEALRAYRALEKEHEETTRMIAQMRRRARTLKAELRARVATLPCIRQ